MLDAMLGRPGRNRKTTAAKLIVALGFEFLTTRATSGEQTDVNGLWSNIFKTLGKLRTL